MEALIGYFAGKEVSGSRVREALEKMRSRGSADEVYLDLKSEQVYKGRDSERVRSDLKSIGSESAISESWLARRQGESSMKNNAIQPIEYNGVWLMMEGEILNKERVISELGKEDYSFSTRSSAEIMVKAADLWSIDELSRKIKGIYTVFIYEASSQVLKVFNDYLGQKPMYYARSGSSFTIASEIKPIIQISEMSAVPDYKRIAQYLEYGLTDNGRHTFFEGVNRLRPGEVLEYDGEKLEKRNYADLGEDERDLKLQEIQNSLEDAFNYRTRGESVGVTLGGLDSAAIAAFLGEEGRYYSSFFPETSFDESESIKVVSDSLGIDVSCVEASSMQSMPDINELVRTLEEPVVTPVAHSYMQIAELASDEEREVVVSGDSADALFSYGLSPMDPVYFLLRRRKYKEAFALYRGLRGFISLGDYKRFFSFLLPPGIRSRIVKRSESNAWTDFEDVPLGKSMGRPDDYKERLSNDLLSGPIQNVIRYGVKAFANSSISFRSAYLDRNLVNTMMGKSTEEILKERVNKYHIKKLYKEELPEFVTSSGKTGFIEDFAELMSSEDWEKFEELIESDRFESRRFIDAEKFRDKYHTGELHINDVYRVWSVEVWMREFID